MTRQVRAPGLATYAAVGVQLGLAIPLLLEPTRHATFRTYFFYYGVVVTALPFALDAAVGDWLHPLQRLGVVAAPCAHAYGVLLELYGRLAWWDVVTHGLSAGLLAAGAYLVLLVIVGANRVPKRRLHAIPFAVVLVAGVGWEVYESLVPWLIVYGPLDTARDLVVDVLAWAVVSQTYPSILGATTERLRWRVDFVRSVAGH